MQVHFQIGQIAEAPAPTVADPGLAAYRVAVRRMGQARMQPIEPRHPGSRRKKSKRSAAGRLHRLLVRAGIAAAALAVVAGCATLDADTAKAWKIEPVLNVAHAMQSSQAYYTMGRYHDGSQAWDKAAEAYRKAIAVDARNIEAYNALGVALARSGRLADAETTLRQATALDPSRAHVRSNLGYVLLLAGKSSDAVVELRGAVMLDASNQGAMANLRDALEQRNAARGSSAGSTAQMSDGEQPAVASPTTFTTEAKASISVPAPITSVEVPSPLAGTVNLAAPVTTASVPAPLQTASVAAVLPASLAATPQAGAEMLTATEVIRVVDRPTVGSLEEKTEAPNRPLVRQSIIRSVELPAPLAEAALFRLEVSNGNGVTGMAARVSKWLGEQGVAKGARLTNQKAFDQENTVVQYRSGQEAAAQRVARSLPTPAVAEPAPTAGLRGDVRVVLGRDWVKVGVCLDDKTCRPHDTSVAVVNPGR